MKICPQCGTQYTVATSFCPRDGEALGDDHSEMIGRVLNEQYQIEEFIAEGGMGAVYRARHILLGDRVAIKILPAEMRSNIAWLKRFQREGQAARRFHHPNSVIVHDLRTSEDGSIYLVMEYVEGRTLGAEMTARGGRLSPADSLRIIEPVASVLDAAHAMGVVHRDLKPSNIMITEQGRVKLLDLGVAKVTDLGQSATQLTVTGQLLGTPFYMSPEQWGELPRDGSEEIDGRTDIYSLGVVVYQMTTGEFPFHGTSVVTLRRAHCHENPRPPDQLDLSIPPAWSQAILRALSKDRNDRQATASEFARELRAALGETVRTEAHALPLTPTLVEERRDTPRNMQSTSVNQTALTGHSVGNSLEMFPTVATPFQPPSYLTQRPGTTRTKWILISIAAILILVGGGLAVWFWGSGKSADQKQTARGMKSSGGEATSASPGEAFLRYHVQVSPSIFDDWVRTSGREPIAAGQIAEFIFFTRESGYLYLLGHDSDGNSVVIPLSDSGAGAQITAGTETDLPSLPLMKLDSPSGVESFTVIFADKPLLLSFVSETLPLDGSFRKLTAEDRRQLEDLRRQAAPVTIQFEGDRENEAAVVRLAGERGAKPVLFDINLKLQR